MAEGHEVSSNARVNIQFEVKKEGARRVIELPFVVGVMADLAGKSKKAQTDLSQRTFDAVTAKDLDSYMEQIAPRVSFAVANKLKPGGGDLPVDITFKNMGELSPDGIVEGVDELRDLSEERQKLVNLLTYMDGRGDAQAVLAELLKNPQLQALAASAPRKADDTDKKD